MSLLPYKVTAIKDFDATGQNVMPYASVSVLNKSGGYAALKTDDTGATPLGNPFTCDVNGEKEFWILGGSYIITVDGGQSWEIQLSGASDIQSVDEFSDLSTTPATLGQMIMVKGNSSAGIASVTVVAKSGSVSGDGYSQVNSATGGLYWDRVGTVGKVVNHPDDAGSENYAFQAVATGYLPLGLTITFESANLLFNSGSLSAANGASGSHDGDNLTAFGFGAMQDVTTGYASSAFGFAALNNMTTGQGNTGLGYQSLLKLTTGENNTAVGTDCGFNATTASGNTLVGHHVFFLGSGATDFTGTDNVVVSENTGRNATTAYDNVIVGKQAQYQIIDSYRSVVIGKSAGFTPTSLIDSVLIGTSCAETSVTMNYCTHIGARNNINTQVDTYSVTLGRDCFYTDAGSNKTNGYNTAFGVETGYYVWGQRNTLLGNRAGSYGSLTELNGVVAIGYRAGDGWAASNDLIIANNELNTNPLIYGNFTSRNMELEATKLKLRNIPTSAAGLASGEIWNDAGTLKIV